MPNTSKTELRMVEERELETTAPEGLYQVLRNGQPVIETKREIFDPATNDFRLHVRCRLIARVRAHGGISPGCERVLVRADGRVLLTAWDPIEPWMDKPAPPTENGYPDVTREVTAVSVECPVGLALVHVRADGTAHWVTMGGTDALAHICTRPPEDLWTLPLEEVWTRYLMPAFSALKHKRAHRGE